MEFGRSKDDDDNAMIVAFLALCVSRNEELDSDDIQHILEKDFDYVRKQWESVEASS